MGDGKVAARWGESFDRFHPSFALLPYNYSIIFALPSPASRVPLHPINHSFSFFLRLPKKTFISKTSSMALNWLISSPLLFFCLFHINQISGAVIELPTIGTEQSVSAKGKLLCAGKPYKGAKVKLYDVDTTDPDDLLGQTVSDEDGLFEVQGWETEITDIDPKLNIYHNCEDEQHECLRKFSIEIPDSYISKGQKSDQVFDAGILNLSGHFPSETRDCINKKK